jgi:hypothetical protein
MWYCAYTTFLLTASFGSAEHTKTAPLPVMPCSAVTMSWQRYWLFMVMLLVYSSWPTLLLPFR